MEYFGFCFLNFKLVSELSDIFQPELNTSHNSAP